MLAKRVPNGSMPTRRGVRMGTLKSEMCTCITHKLTQKAIVRCILHTLSRSAAQVSAMYLEAATPCMWRHLASMATWLSGLPWQYRTLPPMPCDSSWCLSSCGGMPSGQQGQRCDLHLPSSAHELEHATLGHMWAGLADGLHSQTPVRRQICWRNYNVSIPHNGLCFECQSPHPLLNMFRNIMLYSSVRMCIIWSCMSCRFNWMNLIESAMLMIDSIEIIWTSVNISWAGQAHTKNLWAACWKYVTA